MAEPQKFEYDMVEHDTAQDLFTVSRADVAANRDLLDVLNAMGAAGWEVVAGNQSDGFVLRRPSGGWSEGRSTAFGGIGR